MILPASTGGFFKGHVGKMPHMKNPKVQEAFKRATSAMKTMTYNFLFLGGLEFSDLTWNPSTT
jgi:hypothetical protein